MSGARFEAVVPLIIATKARGSSRDLLLLDYSIDNPKGEGIADENCDAAGNTCTDRGVP